MATFNCYSANDYRQKASQMANELERIMARLEHWSDQLAAITAEDLTALGLTNSTQVGGGLDEQTQMGSMRTTIAALVAAYYANPNRVFVTRHGQLDLMV